MLRKYYYKNILHERLAYLKDWVVCADTYRRCMKITERVEIELFKEKPTFYIIIYLYFLPMNILKLVNKIKRNYYFMKNNKEIEIIRKEIEILELKEKDIFYYGKKITKQ